MKGGGKKGKEGEGRRSEGIRIGRAIEVGEGGVDEKKRKEGKGKERGEK